MLRESCIADNFIRKRSGRMGKLALKNGPCFIALMTVLLVKHSESAAHVTCDQAAETAENRFFHPRTSGNLHPQAERKAAAVLDGVGLAAALSLNDRN